MLYVSSYRFARFKPYSAAVQTRFKWRHKQNDHWRRLMDASCFIVDWFSQTNGPTLGQYSGHWSHILTCAHVICPWDYPNYYSPDGPARYVSHITIADTMTQLRIMSMQGKPIEKHFCSNQHIYVHSNPQLDICAIHAQQYYHRFGQMRLLNWQNNGLIVYPRLEINAPLRVGDEVWIYGMQAHESLFDEQKMPQPLMIPTGIRGRVHTLSRQHFFVTTIGVQRAQFGEVHMGMCGSAVIRDGKCVGMLTAMVHRQSDCKELAGTAMCTYATDIFQFLLQVEKQMKNAIPPVQGESGETQFQQRRRKQLQKNGVSKNANKHEYKNWQLDRSRLARHVGAPLALLQYKQEMQTGQKVDESSYFGRDGIYNQQVQQNVLGYNLSESSSDGTWPEGLTKENKVKKIITHPNQQQQQRCDTSPRNVYLHSDNFAVTPTKQEAIYDQIFKQSQNDVVREQWSRLQSLRKSLQTIRREREIVKTKQSAFSQVNKSADKSNEVKSELSNQQQNYTNNHNKSTYNSSRQNNDFDHCNINDKSDDTQIKVQHTETHANVYTAQTNTNDSTLHTSQTAQKKQTQENQVLSEERKKRTQSIRRKKQERKEQEAKYREQLQRGHQQDNLSFDNDFITNAMHRRQL